MRVRIFGMAVMASVALLAGGGGQASAITACTSSEGATTLPGTNIGTIGSGGCEIGAFNASEGQNSMPAVVNTSSNPSIYEFTWGGGGLEIQEEVGNNGSDFNINVELGLVSGNSLQTGGNLTSALASNFTPFQSGPSAPIVLYDGFLASGTYALDTYLGTCEVAGSNCSSNQGDSTDPEYQVLFSATPLPGTLPLFAGALGFVGYLTYRRKRSGKQAVAAA